MIRPAPSTLIVRALRLLCPRCGKAPMFTGLFAMHPRCPHCHWRFERDPGYFLGSIYINYGLTSLITTIGYLVLFLGYEVDSRYLLWGFTAFCILFPAFFFRYARALWVAFDCRFDSSIFVTPEDPERGESALPDDDWSHRHSSDKPAP